MVWVIGWWRWGRWRADNRGRKNERRVKKTSVAALTQKMRRASTAFLAAALRAGAGPAPPTATTATARAAASTAASSTASVRLEDSALPPPAFIVGTARPPPTPLDLAAAVEKVQVRELKGGGRPVRR